MTRHKRAWEPCSAALTETTYIVRAYNWSLWCYAEFSLALRQCRHCTDTTFLIDVPLFSPLLYCPEADYGGYFSDNPNVAPNENQLYQYSVSSKSWSASNARGDTVTRVAEGASAVSPPQGNETEPTFYYFGGHIDSYTAEDWSNQTPRVYLSSMIEYNQATNSWTNHSSVCLLLLVYQVFPAELTRRMFTSTLVPLQSLRIVLSRSILFYGLIRR